MNDYSGTPSENKKEEERRRKEKAQGLFFRFGILFVSIYRAEELSCCMLI